MRTVAIMQPYFFAYIGYFTLIANSDCFVFYDDAQYIKGGWSNRNGILLNGARSRIMLPVAKSRSTDSYAAKAYVLDTSHVESLLDKIRQAYRTAPFFADAFPVLQASIENAPVSVAEFNRSTTLAILAYLRIDADTCKSSDLDKDTALRGQARVIDICRRLDADAYLNPSGGRDLYDARAFARHDMVLQFCRPRLRAYRQRGETFVPGLSIIDALMFNSPEAVRRMLYDCEIETATA